MTVATADDPILSEPIFTTAEHPFYVKDRGWTKTQELSLGDELRTAAGGWASVKHFASTERTEPVFNIRVEDSHTYFVLPTIVGEPVLVHNDSKSRNSDDNDLTAAMAKINALQDAIKKINASNLTGSGTGVGTGAVKKLIVTALQAQIDELNKKYKVAIDEYLRQTSDALDEVKKELENVTDNDGVKDALKALERSNLPKSLKEKLKDGFESLEKGGDVVGKVKDILDNLQAVKDDLQKIHDAAGQEGNYLIVAADLMAALNKYNKIPGISDMINFYAGAVKAIGGTINFIQNEQAKRNFEGLTEGPELLNIYPRATYGTIWAKEVLRGIDPENKAYNDAIADEEHFYKHDY